MPSTRSATIIAALLTLLASTAWAAPRPYVRGWFGLDQLRMTDLNSRVEDEEREFRASGLPAAFSGLGSAPGAGASAGLWLGRGLRVGGIAAVHRARRHNRLESGDVRWDDAIEERLDEVGGEAALRLESLHGLTIGMRGGRGRATASEQRTAVNVPGAAATFGGEASRTRPTWAAWVGLDQANDTGFAGFFRAGWQWRDMGRLQGRFDTPSTGLAGQYANETVWTDFSGLFFEAGIGWDLMPRRTRGAGK